MKLTKILRSVAAGALGIGLIVGLLHYSGVTPQSLTELIVKLNWFAFAGIVVCSYIYIVLGGIKWHLISAVPPPRRFFYTHYTAQALLLGQFLPAPIAIAASRAAVMKFKQKVGLKKGLLNAIYDMGFDFLIALLMVPVSLLQWYYHFPWSLWLAFSLLLIIVTGFVLREVPHIVPEAWLEKLGLHEERKTGMLSRSLIGAMMLLSAVRYALAVSRFALAVSALGVAIPVTVVTYATPLITMSALLMFTPANLGIAEWSWAYVLTLWGLPVAAGALFGVGFRILLFGAQLIVSGLCALLYWAAGRANPGYPSPS